MTITFNKTVLGAGALLASTIIASSANAQTRLSQNPTIYGSQIAKTTTAFATYDRAMNMLNAYFFGGNATSGDKASNNAWVKVSGSQEDVRLDHVDIDSNTYSIVFGTDSDVKHLENGVKAIYSIYGSYADSEQKVNGLRVDQDIVSVGARALFNKGSWFAGAVADLGMSFATEEFSLVSGKYDFESYIATVGANVGYDYKFYCDYFSLRPSVAMAYVFMNTPNYETFSGARVKSDALHTLFITPELRALVDLDGRSNAYAAVSYTWNTTGNGDVTRAGVAMNDVNLESYAKYSVGYENNAFYNISGYAEVFATTGGRDGWGGEIGVKYDF